MLRRRHEPRVDGRRDPGHVPQGALARYVALPPARARAAPVGPAHRPSESARAPTREPSPRLHATAPILCPAHLPTPRPVARRTDPTVPTPAILTTASGADDYKTDVRTRVHANRSGRTAREKTVPTSTIHPFHVVTHVFVWNFIPCVFVR